MPKELDIMIIEDVLADAAAIEQELRSESIAFKARRLDTRDQFLAELERSKPDLILSDFTLPHFNALEALTLLQERRADIPFILITGTRSEEVAVECIRHGADDYILKASLKRLPSSIQNALSKKEAQRHQAEAETALRRLPKLIRDAQETERRRVARELHDGVIQILSSVKFRFQSIEERLDERDPELSAQVVKAAGLLEKAIAEVRHISRNLRPSELDDLGLAPAVRSLCQEFQDRTGLPLVMRIEPLPPALPDETELNVYRIIQEALANIEKHARASRVKVVLTATASFLQLSIADDGIGLQSYRAKSSVPRGKLGMGLLDIRERATIAGGFCEFKSLPGQGTEIFLSIPLPVPGTARGKPSDKTTKKKDKTAPSR